MTSSAEPAAVSFRQLMWIGAAFFSPLASLLVVGPLLVMLLQRKDPIVSRAASLAVRIQIFSVLAALVSLFVAFTLVTPASPSFTQDIPFLLPLAVAVASASITLWFFFKYIRRAVRSRGVQGAAE